MPALEFADVTKRYGSRAALSEVSLVLEEGRALGLLGPNGAGKTTLLRLLLGFARPTRGAVRLFGGEPGRPASRRGVGYLPERLTLPGRMSVRGFLAHQARLAGVPGSEAGRQVEGAMEQVGVSSRAGDRLDHLSKGLRQRVGFASAFLGPPRLLLLDEPTTGLDPIGIRDARSWVASARERGCSLLVSSHILSEVERSCDRLAILHEGRIVASGAREEIVQPGETLEDAFVRCVGA